MPKRFLAPMAIYQFNDCIPEIDPSAYVASEAVIIGRVRIGPGASIWPGSVLRGDNDPIIIGAASNIQDGSVLHTDAGSPLTIGERVTVGHQAMLHGCTIGDGSLIGIQAVILNQARIGINCLVGAGALVTEGKQFDPGMLIFGSPAKAHRALKDGELAGIHANTAHYAARAVEYRTALKRIG